MGAHGEQERHSAVAQLNLVPFPYLFRCGVSFRDEAKRVCLRGCVVEVERVEGEVTAYFRHHSVVSHDMFSQSHVNYAIASSDIVVEDIDMRSYGVVSYERSLPIWGVRIGG